MSKYYHFECYIIRLSSMLFVGNSTNPERMFDDIPYPIDPYKIMKFNSFREADQFLSEHVHEGAEVKYLKYTVSIT